MTKRAIAFFAMTLSLTGWARADTIQGQILPKAKGPSLVVVHSIVDARRDALLKRLDAWAGVFPLSCIPTKNGMDESTRRLCEKRCEYFDVMAKTKLAKTEKELQAQELAFKKLEAALKALQPSYPASDNERLLAAKKNIQRLNQTIRPDMDRNLAVRLNHLYIGREIHSEPSAVFAQRPPAPALKPGDQAPEPRKPAANRPRFTAPPAPDSSTHFKYPVKDLNANQKAPSSEQQKPDQPSVGSPTAQQAREPVPYEDIILSAAALYKVSPDVIKAIIAAKSKYNAGLRGPGAYGLMGISGAVARAYGHTTEDLQDPAVNIDIGTRLLAQLLRQFRGDLHRALAAYQAGPADVLRSRGIPNDRNVKDFLAAFERAYRGASPKPPVQPIATPEPGSPKIVLQEVEAQFQDALAEVLSSPWPGWRASWWRPLITRVADAFHVDARLMEAMVQHESQGDPVAVSKKKAAGLGQLMPGTAADLGVKNPFDPVQNLIGMAKYLNQLLKKYDGNKVLAVAAYNAGPSRVDRAKGNVPDNFETPNYVARVTNTYEKLGGDNLGRLLIIHMPKDKGPVVSPTDLSPQ